MNIAQQLPNPLNTFVLDVEKNHYYDFELEPDSTYPLKGVTYPVDYGHILGYVSEDGHELDLFVGSEPSGETGYVLVYRGEDRPDEHKFYAGLSSDEVAQVLGELGPVLIEHGAFANLDELLKRIEEFKRK